MKQDQTTIKRAAVVLVTYILCNRNSLFKNTAKLNRLDYDLKRSNEYSYARERKIMGLCL